LVGDRIGREWAIWTEPLRRPIERAQECARRDRRVARAERAPADAGGDQRADAPLVPVAFGDDDGAPLRGEGIDLEVGRRPFDFSDQTQDVADGELAQALGQWTPIALRGGQRGQQPVQRAVLAEKQELVFAAEIVVEVGGRQIGGERDIAHAGGGETAAAKDLRGGAQDVDAPVVRADRTAVRKLNHRSILAHFSGQRVG